MLWRAFPSPNMFPQLLFLFNVSVQTILVTKQIGFGWAGNTKHGITNIWSSLYIQHMASWIPPPFARIHFSSLIRATWRRDLVMFPAVFHCCQPVMNENSDSNASTMVMIMPMKEFMKIKANERENFHLRRKENWTHSRFIQPILYL